MTALLAASLSLLMIFTALLSGVFGMAGGLILIGVLLVVMPLPQAMVLHAVTQMASNGWRAILWWRHIEWKIAAASVVGSVVAVGLWSIWLYVPDKAVALLLLGISPFIVRAIPASVLPKTLGPGQMLVGSAICRMLMLTAGVTGPLLDTCSCVAARTQADHRHQGGLPALQPYVEARLFRCADRAIGIGRAVVPCRRRRIIDDRHVARQAPAREAERQAVPRLVEPHHHGDCRLLCRLRPGPVDWHRLRGSPNPRASFPLAFASHRSDRCAEARLVQRRGSPRVRGFPSCRSTPPRSASVWRHAAAFLIWRWGPRGTGRCRAGPWRPRSPAAAARSATGCS